MNLTSHDIRRLRTEAGIVQYALSNCAGVERTRISLIENGHVQPTQSELERLAHALETLTGAKQKR